MSKFLVTDPCYIISRSEWDRLGHIDGFGDGFVSALSGYEGEGFKILMADGTANGDGSISGTTESGDFYDIGVDAGLVCIAEIKDSLDFGHFGAVVGSLSEARNIYALAKQI